MERNKKSRPAAGNSDPAGRNEAEQSILCLNHITPAAARQAQLKTLDQAMAAADLAGDYCGYADSFQGWLNAYFLGVQND